MSDETQDPGEDSAILIEPNEHAARHTGRPRGRRPGGAPLVNYEELDKLLVEGEVRDVGNGRVMRVYPSYGQLAIKYGVTKPLIVQYSTRHNCQVRRKEFALKEEQEALRAEQKAVKEQGASALPQHSPVVEGTLRRGGKKVIPWDLIDELLVFGESVADADGKPILQYPSCNELARRFGVASSTIATWSKQQNCPKRRSEHQTRLAIRFEEKVIEKRANAKATSRAELMQLADEYFERWGSKLKEGGVRTDSPQDFDKMVRLWEYLQGNADTRTEVNGTLTLQAVQERHAAVQKIRALDPAEAGLVVEESPTRIDELGEGMTEPAELPGVVESDGAEAPANGSG